MVFAVLLKRYANWFVFADAATVVAELVEAVFGIKTSGAVEPERNVPLIDGANFSAAARLACGQKNHAPAASSRHSKIQIVGRERINNGSIIFSHNHLQSEPLDVGDDVRSL
jgi:hypothetical protein